MNDFINNIENNQLMIKFLFEIIGNKNKIIYLTNAENNLLFNNIVYQSGVNFNNKIVFDNLNNDILFIDIIEKHINNIDLSFYNKVKIYITNIENNSINVSNINLLYIGNIVNYGKNHNNIYRLYVQSLVNQLNVQIGEFYSNLCRANLGDSRCKKNISNFIYFGKVVNILSSNSFIGNHSSLSNSFTLFTIEFLSGKNVGYKSIVQNVNNDVINIMYNINFELNVDDEYKIIPNCDKSKFMCENKFNNIINFHGE